MIITTLFLWLLIISIVYFYQYTNLRSDLQPLCDIIDNYEQLILVDYAQCCNFSTNPDDCACNGTARSVKCWDANTNDPMLQSGIPPTIPNVLFVVCTPGATTLNGISIWNLGDYAWFDEDLGTWMKNEASGGSSLLSETFTLNIYPRETTVPGKTVLLPPYDENVAVGSINVTVYTISAEAPHYVLYSSGFDILWSSASSFETDPLPPQYQFNVSNRDAQSYRSLFSGFLGSFDIAGPVEEIYVTIDLSQTLRIANGVPGDPIVCIFNDEIQETERVPITFANFFFSYTTTPIEIEHPEAANFSEVPKSDPFTILPNYRWGNGYYTKEGSIGCVSGPP